VQYLTTMIYQVEDPNYQSYLQNGSAGKVSAKEHKLNNFAAGSFCA
jgi:hypothetical protein